MQKSRQARARVGGRRLILLSALVAFACGQGEPSTAREQTELDASAGPRRNASDGGRDARSEAKSTAADASRADTTGARDAGQRGAKLLQPSFCARAGDDTVRDLFCGEAATAPRDLVELEKLLRVHPYEEPRADAGSNDPYRLANATVFLSHSTSLSGQLVSPINPRAILLGRDDFLAFQRGVQRVEIASRARGGSGFNFYLLSFRQRCNEQPDGCSAGELYTGSIEQDWLEVRIEDDEELKNSPNDCRQCHQRGRADGMLLMRELDSPWTHFFQTYSEDAPPSDRPGVSGQDLVADYLRAKGDETYGGVPAEVIRRTIALALENRVPIDQPLLFDAPAIDDERWPFGPDGFAREPRRSDIWYRAYEAFQRGEQLALPHFEPRPTDVVKQEKLTEAYQRYRAGELDVNELPSLADIFPDDPAVRAEIGLQTAPDASPAQLLVQACGSCHNDVLDQEISRARFSIDLSRMPRAELDLAIARIVLPREAEGVMPPPEARQLTPEARESLLSYLRANERTADDDALLERAARLGMAGGARPARARP